MTQEMMAPRLIPPANFTHAIDPTSEQAFYPCLQLANINQLFSSDYYGLRDPVLIPLHSSLRNVPLETLRSIPFPAGVISPISRYLVIAALARAGQQILHGDGSRLPEHEIKYSIARADIEIEFERIRREVAPQAPSRLNCLFLGEHQPDSMNMVRGMLGPNIHFLDVSIKDAVLFLRADPTYWEHFGGRAHKGWAVSYWEGKPASSTPRWEYLLDGIITPKDRKQVANLCKAHVTALPPPWSTRSMPPENLLALAREAE